MYNVLLLVDLAEVMKVGESTEWCVTIYPIMVLSLQLIQNRHRTAADGPLLALHWLFGTADPLCQHHQLVCCDKNTPEGKVLPTGVSYNIALGKVGGPETKEFIQI